MRRLLCVLIVLSLFSGCRKRHGSVAQDGTATSSAQQEMAVLDEARLVDVSLPIGVIAYDLSSNDQQTVTSYEARFTLEMLRDFYAFDMERLGWQQVAEFAATDQSVRFLFEKPTRWCIISLEYVTSELSRVVISLGPKEQNFDSAN